MAEEREQSDPYETLGLTGDCACSREAISKAARKLGLKYHPDKNPTAEAADKFLQVQKAKELLLDDTRRAQWDGKLTAALKRKAHEEQRAQGMNKRRRDFKADLEQRVSTAMGSLNTQQRESLGLGAVSATGTGTANMQSTAAGSGQQEQQLQLLRQEGQARAAEQGAQQQRARQRGMAALPSAEADADTEGGAEAETEVKIKWRRTAQSHSEDSMRDLLQPVSSSGTLQQVRLVGTKGTAAVAVYRTHAAAAAAVAAMKGNDDFRLSLQERVKDKERDRDEGSDRAASAGTSSGSGGKVSNASLLASLRSGGGANTCTGTSSGTSSGSGSAELPLQAGLSRAHEDLLWDLRRIVDRHGLDARMRERDSSSSAGSGSGNVSSSSGRSSRPAVPVPVHVQASAPAPLQISADQLAHKEAAVLGRLVGI